jgi:hypothetical protein
MKRCWKRFPENEWSLEKDRKSSLITENKGWILRYSGSKMGRKEIEGK